MGKTVQVSKQFAENFGLVSVHYACLDEEIAAMKQSARADIEAAETSFRLMAQEIKDGVQFQ